MQLAQPQVRAWVPPAVARLAGWLRGVRSVGVRWFREGTTFRRRGAASDSCGKARGATLRQVVADLDHLNHNTEQDFLRIGGKLAEFIETVNLISSELKTLADLISEEYGLHASEAFTSALHRSEDMAARGEENNDLLDRMRQDAVRLKRTLSGFKGAVSNFRTLGVLARIETARLGGAGADFANLADEVRMLAANVQVRVEGALDTSALLISPIESAMQDVSAIGEGQAKELPSLISGVLANLSSLRDMQKRVHETSIRLGARYDAISDAFNQLIVSIQFHDITRQQVDHVIQVLRLFFEFEGESGLASAGHGDAAAVLALQSRQLADAGEKFATSVGTVARNMDEIAGHVLEMAGESRTLTGLSADGTNSSLLEIERACTAILTVASRCATGQAAIEVTGRGLAETVGRARGPIDEIRAIEVQIQRLALNAAIRAAHLGSSGDVLGVLAGSMQRLALDCRERSDALAEALGGVGGAAARLSGQGQESTNEADSQGRGMAGMRASVAELHSSSERSFAQIAQIVTRGARLSDDLSATRRSFSVGALFAETIGRARGMIEEIEQVSIRESSRDGASESGKSLTDFASHYTMQSERDVHEGVGRTVPGAVGAERSESAPTEAGDLGGNVEFF